MVIRALYVSQVKLRLKKSFNEIKMQRPVKRGDRVQVTGPGVSQQLVVRDVKPSIHASPHGDPANRSILYETGGKWQVHGSGVKHNVAFSAGPGSPPVNWGHPEWIFSEQKSYEDEGEDLIYDLGNPFEIKILNRATDTTRVVMLADLNTVVSKTPFVVKGYHHYLSDPKARSLESGSQIVVSNEGSRDITLKSFITFMEALNTELNRKYGPHALGGHINFQGISGDGQIGLAS